MSDSVEVVTLGEIMALFWPAIDEPIESAELFSRSFGGAEGNTAIALSRLGHRTRLISRLGADEFGRYIRHGLENEQVVVDAEADDDNLTAVFFKERVTSGPRHVLYYRRDSAASSLGPQHLRIAQFAGTRVAHLTGITPALSSSCAAAVIRAIELARRAGSLVTFDPNVRMRLWPDERSCREHLRDLVSRCDVALIGHEDALVLYPGLSEWEIISAARADGASTVVLKLGARGAIAANERDSELVDAAPVDRLVDTVGAGDGFNAGFIAGYLRGFTLRDSLSLATRVGARAVSASGDWEGYPTASELGLDPAFGIRQP